MAGRPRERSQHRYVFATQHHFATRDEPKRQRFERFSTRITRRSPDHVASIAQTLYRETEASKEARRLFAEERRAGLHFTPAPAGRPSKRDRRRIIRFRSS